MPTTRLSAADYRKRMGLSPANRRAERAPRQRPVSPLVSSLVFKLSHAGVEIPRWAGHPGGELKPVPGRLFRFDLAWPERLVAAEVDGGVWVKGRHNRGKGMIADSEKYSLAAGLGWRVLRLCDVHVKDGRAVEWIKAALEWRHV